MSAFNSAGKRLLLSTALGLVSVSSSAWAQDGGAAEPVESAESTDVIMVTANRREERSQDVGISISAFSGETLETKNIRTAEDLAKTVPGLNSTASSGSSVSTVVIRGVGVSDFNDHQEQPNATYQDGVYIPFSTAIGIPVYDMQRVEVLRGPQGTLFGRNATGGLIQYIANKPRAGTSGSISGGLGERDLRRVQGFINAGNDTLAIRVSGYYLNQDGFIKNVNGRNRGDKEVGSLRAQLKWTPDDRTTVIFRAEGFNQDGTNPGYLSYPAYYPGATSAYLPPNVDAWGSGPGNDFYGYRNPYDLEDLTVELNNDGKLMKRARSYSLTIERDIGFATLTSITAYNKVKNEYVEDTDSTPFTQFEAGNRTSADSWQQDLRITGKTGPLNFTAGAFFLDINGHYSLYNLFDSFLAQGFGGSFSGPEQDFVTIRNDYGVHTKSQAIYGQLEYALSDKLTFTLGARYTWDQIQLKDLSISCIQTIADLCGFFDGTPNPLINQEVTSFGPVTLDNNYSDWSGKVQLNYKPNPDLLLYASASRGTKSAGYTAPLTSLFPVANLPYAPERLNAFEIGEKATLMNGRVIFNVSLYYYDYHDFQTFLFQNVATQILSRNAQAYGGEFELSGRFGNGWTGFLGGAYNHFLVQDIETPFSPSEEQRPINQPKFQLIWGLGKSTDLGRGLTLDVNYNGRFVDEAYYNIVNVPIVKAPSYVVHDFNVRLESDHGWWIAGYLNNAFDERYQVGAFDVAFFGWSLRQMGEPRTASFEVGYRF